MTVPPRWREASACACPPERSAYAPSRSWTAAPISAASGWGLTAGSTRRPEFRSRSVRSRPGVADTRPAISSGRVDVEAARAVHLGQLVEARIDEIDADVAPAEVALLLGLLGAVAAVVQHDADQRNAPAHGGVDFLRGVEKAAVALQAHRGPVGPAELGAEADAEPMPRPPWPA